MNQRLKTAITNFIGIFPYVLVGIIIILFIVNGRERASHEETVSALQSEMTIYQLKNKQLVSSKQTVILNNKQLKKVIESSKSDLLLAKEFSKPKAVIKIINTLQIDTIRIVFRDTIPCVFDKKEILNTNEYKLKIRSTQKGVTISDLQVVDSLTFISGVKRKWLLGKSTYFIDVKHSNKYIKTSGLEHYELKEKKAFYDTTLFKVGLGLIGGFMIAN